MPATLRSARITPQAQDASGWHWRSWASGKNSRMPPALSSGQLVRAPSRLPLSGLVQLRLLTTDTLSCSRAGSSYPSEAQADNSSAADNDAARDRRDRKSTRLNSSHL